VDEGEAKHSLFKSAFEILKVQCSLSPGTISCKKCMTMIESFMNQIAKISSLPGGGPGPLTAPQSDPALNSPPIARPPTTPEQTSEAKMTQTTFLRTLKRKAQELSTSSQFAKLKDGKMEDFSLVDLAKFFKDQGGLVYETMRAIVGKDDNDQGQDGGQNRSNILIAETLAVAVLLNTRSQKCTSFQKILGVVLRYGGCDKQVLSLVSYVRRVFKHHNCFFLPSDYNSL
jgi:hypothetical protein